jgi:hypothetical protein
MNAIKDRGGSFLGKKNRPLYAGSKNKEIALLKFNRSGSIRLWNRRRLNCWES